MVRHCDHCNKKVYFCYTDEQIIFSTSIKFCIAVAQLEGLLKVEGNTPFSPASLSNATEPVSQNAEGCMAGIIRPVPSVWRRPLLPQQQAEFYTAMVLPLRASNQSQLIAILQTSCENEVNSRPHKKVQSRQ